MPRHTSFTARRTSTPSGVSSNTAPPFTSQMVMRAVVVRLAAFSNSAASATVPHSSSTRRYRSMVGSPSGLNLAGRFD